MALFASKSPAFDGVARNAVVILAVIASAVALWLLRGILTQLALALFLAVIIDGLSRAIEHRVPRLPKAAPLLIAIALTILTLIGIVWLIADQGVGFAAQMAGYGPRLEGLVAGAAHAVAVRRDGRRPPSAASGDGGLVREVAPPGHRAGIR